MKSILSLFIVFFIFSGEIIQAQQQYSVKGKTYNLKTEVEGSLTLLWNTIDGDYRYFLKKENDIIELKNTRQKGRYLEEFKLILAENTNDASMDTGKVKFNLASLHDFFTDYNQKMDSNFVDEEKNIELHLRLGAFAGVTNSAYTENPTNALQATVGVDFEIIDVVKLKRHALVFRFKQTFESSDYKYTASQLSLNYRFKFVKTSKFDAFVNCKFVSFTHSKREVTYIIETFPPQIITENVSGSDFNAPVTFGVGADYKVGNGYITFNYNDIVGLNVENNGNFPVDFALGYKFVL